MWLPIIGALVGAPVLVILALRLRRRWPELTQQARWLSASLLAAFAVIYAFNVYAWLIEPKTLVVRRVEIASDRWHGPPLKMAVLSDVHFAGPHVSTKRAERIVARVNALRPDIVLLLGDYVAGHEPEKARYPHERAEVEAGVAALGALHAPLGTVAVLGNHDSWFARDSIAAMLQRAGVAVLWNQNLARTSGAHDFVIAGLADADTADPDFVLARAGAPTGDTIVISHSPDPFAHAPADIALMLAGHTHCGQVSLPLLGRPIVPSRYGQRYACGRIDESGKTLFVTGGIGTSILPVRFLNPPEIALVTLRAAQP